MICRVGNKKMRCRSKNMDFGPKKHFFGPKINTGTPWYFWEDFRSLKFLCTALHAIALLASARRLCLARRLYTSSSDESYLARDEFYRVMIVIIVNEVMTCDISPVAMLPNSLSYFICDGVSGQLQSVSRPWDVIYFSKSMTNRIKTLFSKVHFANCIHFLRIFWALWVY